MDSFEPSAFGPVGGNITLAVLFVLRELTSGGLKEAGKGLWGWARKPALRAPPTSPYKSRSTRFGTTATTAGSCWHSGKEQEWVKPVGRLTARRSSQRRPRPLHHRFIRRLKPKLPIQPVRIIRVQLYGPAPRCRCAGPWMTRSQRPRLRPRHPAPPKEDRGLIRVPSP